MVERYTQDILDQVRTLYQNGIPQYEIAQILNKTKHQVKRMVRKIFSKDEVQKIIDERRAIINKSYISKKYGRLLVLDVINKKFYCRCDCGNELELSKYDVVSGNTQSCGCIMRERIRAFGEISGKYWSKVRIGAYERNIEFDLDIRDAWDVFLQQDRRCAITGVPLTFAQSYHKYHDQTASLDRIDNNIGYMKSNIQWVHKRVNTFRGKLSLENIYSLADTISIFQRRVQVSQAANKWHVKYLHLAKFVSEWSKDPSTQVGSVIFDQNFMPVSFGYNGFPQKIKDNIDLLLNRDQKLKRMVHAEVNSILFAKRDLTDCSIVTWPFLPCSICAAQIIQSGIKHVISIDNFPDRWRDDFQLSQSMFVDAGVQTTLYPSLEHDHWYP